MPTFEITSPDGKKYQVTAPEGATQEEIIGRIKAHQVAGDISQGGKSTLKILDDAVRAIARGITFGYADELAAKMDELTGRGGSYEENLKREQQKTSQIPTAIRVPGEIAGAIGGAVAAAPVTGAVGAATGLSRLPAAAKLIGAGAAGGAVYGSEEAGPGARLGGAAEGGLVGAATGGLLAGGGRVVQHVVNPAARAEAELARAVRRDAGQGGSPVVPGATMADVGGENVKGLLERVAQTPGAGRSQVVPFLTERQQGQMDRIADELSALTGSKRSAIKAVDETIAQRAKDATPLYQAAYQAGDRAIWSPGLERLSSSPTVQSAMRGAIRKWQDNAVADGFGAMNPSSVERGGQIVFGKSVPAFPNLQFWDYTKRAITDAIGQAKKSGLNDKARVLTKLDNAIRDELDRAVPEYAAARQAWAGPTKYLDAIEAGKEILSAKVGAEELSGNFAKLSPSEKEAFRIGAVSAIRARMGNDPAKLGDMTKYLRSPEVRAKVAAIMPSPQAAAAWERRLNFEVGSSELVGRGLRGSQTFRRLMEAQDANSLTGDLIMAAFGGKPPLELMSKLTFGLYGKARDTLRSRTDAELARRLLGAP